MIDAVGGLILWLMSVLRLLSSVFSSFILVSLFSFCPSIAFGIRSFKPRTSSAMRWNSSSRLRFAARTSATTLSTSATVASRRSVRACSDAFNDSVSLASWSSNAKAFSKDSSMACLSCSSCGAVGGAIRGYTYRWHLLACCQLYQQLTRIIYLGHHIHAVAYSTHHCRHDEPIPPVSLRYLWWRLRP